MTAICIFSEIHKENALLLSLRLNIPMINELRANETIIIMGSALNPWKLLDFQYKNPVTYYILQAENVTSHFFQDKKYVTLLRKNPTFHYSEYNALECEKRWGIKSAGIFDWEFLNRTNEYTTCKQPIDLLFYGYMNEEREDVEVFLKEKYPDKNIVFAFGTYHEKLVELLVKAKYVINIPYFKSSALETHRINQALACGCKVFSKRSACESLNKRYESKITFIQDWDEIKL